MPKETLVPITHAKLEGAELDEIREIARIANHEAFMTQCYRENLGNVTTQLPEEFREDFLKMQEVREQLVNNAYNHFTQVKLRSLGFEPGAPCRINLQTGDIDLAE